MEKSEFKKLKEKLLCEKKNGYVCITEILPCHQNPSVHFIFRI